MELVGRSKLHVQQRFVSKARENLVMRTEAWLRKDSLQADCALTKLLSRRRERYDCTWFPNMRGAFHCYCNCNDVSGRHMCASCGHQTSKASKVNQSWGSSGGDTPSASSAIFSPCFASELAARSFHGLAESMTAAGS